MFLLLKSSVSFPCAVCTVFVNLMCFSAKKYANYVDSAGKGHRWVDSPVTARTQSNELQNLSSYSLLQCRVLTVTSVTGPSHTALRTSQG
jgi:hypothetical protein